MNKILFLCAEIMISTTTLFAQNKLQVTECDTNHELTWYLQYLEGQQTIVEVKSNVKLQFESSMDKPVNVYKTYEESGFIFYLLLFPTDRIEYNGPKGRELQIKSYGFDTYKQPLALKAKVPVGLYVMDINGAVGIGCYFEHFNKGNVFLPNDNIRKPKMNIN